MSREPSKPDAPVTSTGVAMLFLPFRVVGRMPRTGMRYLTGTKLPGATETNPDVTGCTCRPRSRSEVVGRGRPAADLGTDPAQLFPCPIFLHIRRPPLRAGNAARHHSRRIGPGRPGGT